jgi:hypothetical protein
MAEAAAALPCAGVAVLCSTAGCLRVAVYCAGAVAVAPCTPAPAACCYCSPAQQGSVSTAWLVVCALLGGHLHMQAAENACMGQHSLETEEQQAGRHCEACAEAVRPAHAGAPEGSGSHCVARFREWRKGPGARGCFGQTGV